VSTAQETYRRLVQEYIGPALRDRGFRGSGTSWVRPHDVYWLMVGLQKSRHSNTVEVQFTVNLLALSKARWDAENTPRGRVAARPTPNVLGLRGASGALPEAGWLGRIGQVIPGAQGDRWWSLHATGDDLVLISEDVLGCLDQWGIPKLRSILMEARQTGARCSHNVGWRNDFQACGQPADVALGIKGRRFFRCDEHAAQLTSQENGVSVVGRAPHLWPDE
jgi:Domain of unknown function (DUF4304)